MTNGPEASKIEWKETTNKSLNAQEVQAINRINNAFKTGKMDKSGDSIPLVEKKAAKLTPRNGESEDFTKFENLTKDLESAIAEKLNISNDARLNPEDKNIQTGEVDKKISTIKEAMRDWNNVLSTGEPNLVMEAFQIPIKKSEGAQINIDARISNLSEKIKAKIDIQQDQSLTPEISKQKLQNADRHIQHEKESLQYLYKNQSNREEKYEDKKEIPKIYESLLSQIWVSYTTGENAMLRLDEATTKDPSKTPQEKQKIADDAMLKAAHGLMLLLDRDAYSSSSTRYAEKGGREMYNGFAASNMFNSFVESKLQQLYAKPSKGLKEEYVEKQTISVAEYNANKEYYTSKGRTVGEERALNENEKIDTKPGHVDVIKQEFFMGQDVTDVEHNIQNKVSDINAAIKKLESNPKIKKDSIAVNISSSVSHISYKDNQGLMARRSENIKDIVNTSLPGVKVNNTIPVYDENSDQRGPKYPPLLSDLEANFKPGSKELSSLLNIEPGSTLQDVVASMDTKRAESPFFKTLEEVMYRKFQYADLSITYEEEEPLPPTSKVVDLKKEVIQPAVDVGEMFKEGLKVMAKNPYYTTEGGWIPIIRDKISNAINGKLLATTFPQTIDGITYPASEYMTLTVGSNRLNDPIKREGDPTTSHNYVRDLEKGVLRNKDIVDWKKGKHVPSNRMVIGLTTQEEIKNFSKNILKSDEDAGRSVTNKERINFVVHHIENTQ